MNDLQKELQELKAKVIELESRIVAEPVKWEPKGGEWWVNWAGVATKSNSSASSIKFGTERATREQAERAAVEMRKFNRLLALRDELCGDGEEVFDWSSNNSKYRLYYYHVDKMWRVTSDIRSEVFTPYFTTKESVQRACDMLNSGEVEL